MARFFNTAAEKIEMAVEDYFRLEKSSERKHEFHYGEVFAMAGASRNHNVIVANIIRSLGNQLEKKNCIVYPSDMRVRIEGEDRYVYPDVSVICGKEEFEDDEQNSLINPMLIIEVLSDSTESYDRGDKFGYYRRLSSLKEYVLVSRDSRKIEKFTRRGDGFWLFSGTDFGQTAIDLDSIQCRLDFASVYDNIEFDPPSS